MKRALFSLIVLISILIPSTTVAVAQPDVAESTFTSEVTGEVIDLGSSGEISWIEENYDLRQTASIQEEYIWFTYGWSNFQLVLIDGPNETETYHATTMGNMEQFYDSWTLVDEEITEGYSWFIGEAEIGGSSLLVFYDFMLDAYGDVDMAFLQFTDITRFQVDLEFIQAEVRVGGEPLVSYIDTDEMSEIARAGVEVEEEQVGDGSSGRTSRSSTASTPDSDDQTTGETSTSRSRTTRGGVDAPDATATATADDDETSATGSRTTRGGSDATSEPDEGTTPGRTSRGGSTTATDDDEGSTSETASDRSSRGGQLSPDEPDDDVNTSPTSNDDLAGLGLISDTEWESPSYGHAVTWDGGMWEVPQDFDDAIYVNVDPPYDVLTLQTVDNLGYVYVTMDAVYESTPRSLVEYWTSADFDSAVNKGVTIIETGTTANTAVVVYETTNSLDQPLIVVMQATFLDDGSMVFSQISASPETIHIVYEQYVDGIQVNGAPIETTFSVEEIQDIAGN